MDRDDGFDEFYASSRPSLVRALTITSGGDVDAASEAADEAFVRAFERWRRVKVMASPQAWTYSVGRNLLRRRFRRRAKERQLLTTGVRIEEGGDVGDRADSIALWHAVAKLPERDRTALAYRYVFGYAEADIAREMGVATGTVSAALSRARASLRVTLSEEAS